ncbi:hypothetical protein G4O51_03505 [Candidatus Bathyarchaeota archaeon A05DMB-2]|nr:hypothetical protein [Candidatus Bathyarchaeota archaeon A05DMB-2]
MGSTEHEAEHALKRALQLYPDLKEIKLFNNYRYYYHSSMSEEDLKAAVTMKMNYIHITKGRKNRIGHNWKAVAEWFIDRFTTGTSGKISLSTKTRTASREPSIQNSALPFATSATARDITATEPNLS